jgi:hypothetical protein
MRSPSKKCLSSKGDLNATSAHVVPEIAKGQTEAQGLGRLRPGLLEPAQSHKGRGQHTVTRPVRRAPERHDRAGAKGLRVLVEHVVRKAQDEGGKGQVERIEAHGGTDHIDGALESPAQMREIPKRKSTQFGFSAMAFSAGIRVSSRAPG